MSNPQIVRVKALQALPYHSVRMPGEVFDAEKGYADLFIKQGLAEAADGAKLTSAPGARKKGTYKRRDMKAEG